MVSKQGIDNKIKQDGANKFKKILEEGNIKAKSHSESASDSMHNEISKLNIKVKELERKLLLSMADKENLKKAMQKDVDNARNYSISKFAEDMVNSLDHLNKVSENIEQMVNDQNKLISNIADAINMTIKDIMSVLKNYEIEPINPLGKVFNHNYHQAVKTIEDDTCENNLIKEVLQCGYTLKDRLLRPAMVVVSRKKDSE